VERALVGADTGVLNLCRPEHSNLVEVRFLSKEKSIGDDGADQRSYDKEYKVFFRF